ncbi:ATP-NAD kinase [Rhodotorula sp. JG-1b]|nr:ATP-NAD kinase [Rhodotorula sp. JG-1b]
MPGALQSGSEGDGNEAEDAADEDEDDEDESEAGDSEDERNTWTRQLAETAVSVREMSRQLGRARVVSHIQSVMIVTKARDNQLTKLTRELALYLMKKPRNGKDRGLVVYVDSQLRKSKRFDAEGIERENPELFRPLPHRRYSRSSSRSQGNGQGQGREQEAEEGQLRYWTNEMCRKSPHLFDFVITLGGDGTVLYTSWLFQQVVPPVIPFALGSLGFLTNFDYADFRPTLDAAIETGVRVNLRMRFTCTVYRAVDEGDDSKCRRQAIRSGKTGGIFMKSLTREGWEAIENGQPLSPNTAGTAGGKGKDKAIKCFSTRPVESFEVLNDLVVDRGPSPYVSQLELFGDEHHMTTVQADGLTVSTPTGSTAYSLSAGGSLVHPEIPAILITPICPHTLSFRPMLLPDSMELRICVPYNSRSTAWASFDGRGRVELRQGDHIKVTASPYPFPTVCADKQSTDWFHSIARTLKWNERQRQKSFVILEEGRKKPRPSNASEQTSRRADNPVCEYDEDEDEDELDEDEDDTAEEYDIDDVSESSPSISASDPPAPAGGMPSMSSKSTSPTSDAGANGSSRPSMEAATTTRLSFHRPDFELLSNASSVSVDIQDDVTERFCDIPPKGRARSRSRARLQQEQAQKRSSRSGGGGAVSIDESDDDKSRDRAFAVLGHDDDDSSQVRLPLSLRPRRCC